MNKILASLCLLLISIPAFAGPYHHQRFHHQRHWHSNHGWMWVAPTIIGGVIGYELSRNQQTIIVQKQQPVVVQNIECDE